MDESISSQSGESGLHDIQVANQRLGHLQDKLNAYMSRKKSQTKRTFDHTHSPLFIPHQRGTPLDIYESPFPVPDSPAIQQKPSVSVATRPTPSPQQQNRNPNIVQTPAGWPNKSTAPVQQDLGAEKDLEVYKRKLTQQKQQQVVSKIEEFYLMRICLLEQKITQLEAAKAKTRREKQLIGRENSRLTGAISKVKENLKHQQIVRRTNQQVATRARNQKKQQLLQQLKQQFKQQKELHYKYQQQKEKLESVIRLKRLQKNSLDMFRNSRQAVNTFQSTHYRTLKHQADPCIPLPDANYNVMMQAETQTQTRNRNVGASNKAKTSKSTSQLPKSNLNTVHTHNRHRACCVMHQQTHKHPASHSRTRKNNYTYCEHMRH